MDKDLKSSTGLVYNDKTLSYSAVVKENPKDSISVIVGDDKDATNYYDESYWTSCRVLQAVTPDGGGGGM